MSLRIWSWLTMRSSLKETLTIRVVTLIITLLSFNSRNYFTTDISIEESKKMRMSVINFIAYTLDGSEEKKAFEMAFLQVQKNLLAKIKDEYLIYLTFLIDEMSSIIIPPEVVSKVLEVLIGDVEQCTMQTVSKKMQALKGQFQPEKNVEDREILLQLVCLRLLTTFGNCFFNEINFRRENKENKKRKAEETNSMQMQKKIRC